MKKIKVLMMSLFAFIMTLGFSSCNSVVEDLMGVEEYFMVLDNVETNLINAETGESLKQAYYDAFAFGNGKEKDGIKYVSLGKDKDVNHAIQIFYESCEAMKNSFQREVGKVLPKGGFIDYTFSMRSGSYKGDVVANCKSTVRIHAE